MNKKRERTPNVDGTTGVETQPPVVGVPKTWLAALAVLLVVPWVVAGLLYLRESRPDAREPSVASPAATVSGAPASAGPWGRLTVTPIIVSPPVEYIAADWGRLAGVTSWFFPGASMEQVESLLSSSGLAADDVSRLRAAARPEPRIAGVVVAPDAELIRRLSPEVRGRIYGELGKSPLNFDQANSFRFLGDSNHAWLGGSLISPETRRVVEPLIYRQGAFLHFADAEAVRSQVSDPVELRRLAKTLLRQSTVLVRLHVDDASQVDDLSEYWGRGGRRIDLRPLLESVVEAGPTAELDVVHLLPTFARNHLYRYPRLTTADLDKPVLANCLWTALNFFRAEPDARFLDVNVALTSLRQDHFIVEQSFQLGDIVAFLDEEGDLFHVAVYLADDLLFSKNGTSPMAPWTIMSTAQLKDYYRQRSGNPRLIYHRRNDL